MPAFKPIKPSQVSKEVTEQLKHAVLLGHFKTGGNPPPLWLHPAGMRRPIVEAVLGRNPDEAFEAMRKHAIESGENLNRMEKTFSEKKASYGL